MENNPLKVVSTEHGSSSPPSTKSTSRQEIQAHFEKEWKTNPKQFDPTRNCMEQERLDRSWSLIKHCLDLDGKKGVDLGCGTGAFSIRLSEILAQVDAVDIATRPLETLKEKGIQNIYPIHDLVPHTKLADDHYDLVVALELIAHLKPKTYRLFMSELSRLVKPKGAVLCSTPIDVDSEDALARFAKLVESEFKVDQWVLSYHRLYLRLCDFLHAPRRFIKGWKEPKYRIEALEKRGGLSRLWFRIQSTLPFCLLWLPIQLVSCPLASLFEKSRWILRSLEKISAFLWNESGVTHALFLGHRRPLVSPIPKEEWPELRKQKKQVWE